MAAHETIFDNGSDVPADLLVNAAAVVGFLKDVLPGTEDEKNAMTETGAFGLYLILTGIENTINAVVKKV